MRKAGSETHGDLSHRFLSFIQGTLLKTLPPGVPFGVAVQWSATMRKKATPTQQLPTPSPSTSALSNAVASGGSSVGERTGSISGGGASGAAGAGAAGASSGAFADDGDGSDGSSNYVKEHFVLCTPDAHIMHFTVEGSIVRNGVRLLGEPSANLSCCLSWKVHGLVGTEGHLWCQMVICDRWSFVVTDGHL